eukprot:15481767-Alexandrium_andersonii.AAC.1
MAIFRRPTASSGTPRRSTTSRRMLPPGAWRGPSKTPPGSRRIGGPQFNTLWEALAVLVSLRVWRALFTRKTPVSVSSDNLGALAILQQHSTPSVALTTIAQECALDDALDPYPLAQLRHIPGVSNDIADALSRQYAPVPKAFPRVLASVRRSIAPARGAQFYHCPQPRIAGARLRPYSSSPRQRSDVGRAD